MKTLDDYMNDSDILAMPEYLREIHAARKMIMDETQGMAPQQKRDYLRQGTDAMFASLGITPKYADLTGQGKIQKPYRETASA